MLTKKYTCCGITPHNPDEFFIPALSDKYIYEFSPSARSIVESADVNVSGSFIYLDLYARALHTMSRQNVHVTQLCELTN